MRSLLNFEFNVFRSSYRGSYFKYSIGVRVRRFFLIRFGGQQGVVGPVV